MDIHEQDRILQLLCEIPSEGDSINNNFDSDEESMCKYCTLFATGHVGSFQKKCCLAKIGCKATETSSQDGTSQTSDSYSNKCAHIRKVYSLSTEVRQENKIFLLGL